MKSLALLAAAALAVSGCANSGSTSHQAAAAPKASTAQAANVRTTARGSFVGDSNHVTSGTAEVYRDAAGWKIRLGPDFSLDGGPDPKVALGNRSGGGYQKGTILGKLTSLKGEQVYALSSGLDIGDYDQVYIWCEQFNVPLGHADLSLL